MTDLLDSTAETGATANIPEYSVGEIAGALKRQIEDSFGRVRVKGEISRIYRAASGHAYLTLKDADAVLEGICFRASWEKLRFQPTEGLEVVVTGKLTTFAKKSQYQIIIDMVAPAGVGALMALLEERRKKLQAEGLFDAARKKPIPYLPQVIGVVTSPTGAVIRDILHRLRDRFPRHVLIWPVLVQGDTAAEKIAAAIRGFNAIDGSGTVPRPDVIIVARGGGSIEDLWCFNEEAVVRAVADSVIPLISAVGHETDTTLIDYAADIRAPTPTAAAEMAVPVRAELIYDVANLQQRLLGGLNRRMREARAELQSARRGLRDPRDMLGLATQRLDDVSQRLDRALGTGLERRQAALREAQQGLRPGVLRDRLGTAQSRSAVAARGLMRALAGDVRHHGTRFGHLAGRLQPRLVRDPVAGVRARLVRAGAALNRDINQRLGAAEESLDAQARLLDSLSYQSVLERGFALVRDASRAHPIKRVAETAAGAAVVIEFADGSVGATIGGTAPAKKATPAPRAAPGASKAPKIEQGDLF
ncbi:MAG: exodeoxyribonuclease VII large subunit [Proteobacteria bacterium]|nr:exodeoxyribonuclease VII large subunit [Pseudomonadota bacterium]MDA1058257.1 exodeoxyribonuclease VII large subunit [Pseudomonadota bacterium]